MSLPDLFKAHVQAKKFFQPGDTLIVACSGGLDSVALAHLLSLTNNRFELAHMNFQLRGEESERDEQFAQTLAAEFNVPFHLRQANAGEYADKHRTSIQVAARELRYNFFKELVDGSTNNRAFVLTAHHSDDNLETVLMNFFRGTGIRGLVGIPEINQHIIRPLLHFSRQQIREFAAQQNFHWVEDSSNEGLKYTRNQVRLELLPIAERIFPNLRGNLQQTIDRFSEVNEVYAITVNRLKRKLIKKDNNNEWRISVAALLNTKPLNTIVFECFREYGFDSGQVSELIALCHAPTGRYMSSTTHRIIRHQKWLLVHKIEPATEHSVILIDEHTSQVQLTEGSIHISTHNYRHHLKKTPLFGQFDKSKIVFPLIIRPWKMGDYFYPFGMEKKKKVARFLIDQKLSRLQKERVLVVEMNKKIIWIVGQRIDNRFRVTENMGEVFVMEVKMDGGRRTLKV